MGAKVIMACRSIERGEGARTKMEEELAALGAATTQSSSSVVGAGTLEVGTSYMTVGHEDSGSTNQSVSF